MAGAYPPAPGRVKKQVAGNGRRERQSRNRAAEIAQKLRRNSVLHLLSPPGRPGYNGFCEAIEWFAANKIVHGIMFVRETVPLDGIYLHVYHDEER
jgi:hypothetical protein